MMGIFLRVLPHIGIAIAAFIAGMWLANTRAKADYGRLDAEFLQYRLDNAEAIKKATEEELARQQEQARRNQQLSLDNAEKDAAITKLAVAVRERFADVRLCQSKRSAARMSEGADHHPGGDIEASAGEELPGTVGGDLVTLAVDADRVMNQLEMCQAFARSLNDVR